jgi:hypothetical protein
VNHQNAALADNKLMSAAGWAASAVDLCGRQHLDVLNAVRCRWRSVNSGKGIQDVSHPGVTDGASVTTWLTSSTLRRVQVDAVTLR